MSNKINDVLKQGKDILIKHNINPREARLLLAYSMGILTDELVKQKECTSEDYSLFLNSLERRVNGEPFAYIVGEKEFMKLKFKVNKYTLIPREDTEILVQKAIEILQQKLIEKNELEHVTKQNEKIKILDMCTGSGCVGISIAKHTENVLVDAVDISTEALIIAKKNAILNNVNINFIHSDLFEIIDEKYDMIVSNPPYIVSNEINMLQTEVKKEPRIALDGGHDGLDFYRKISKKARKYLRDDGIILLEIGFNQGKTVSNMFESDGYNGIEIIKDLSGNDRVIYAQL